MTDRFDVVPIGIQYERTVVIRVIVRAEPRGTVVAATGSHASVMELIHNTSRRNSKCDVKRRLVCSARANPKIRLRRFSEAGYIRVPGNRGRNFRKKRIANCSKSGDIEGPALGVVRDNDTRVIDHVTPGEPNGGQVAIVLPNVEVTGGTRQDALPARCRIDKQHRAGKVACRVASG